MKKSTSETIIKEINESVNTKQETKEKTMKKINIDWKVVKTVTIMIALTVLFVLGGVAGWHAHNWFNENVKSEVKALSSVVSKD